MLKEEREREETEVARVGEREIPRRRKRHCDSVPEVISAATVALRC